MATTSTDQGVRPGQDLWTVDDVAAYFRVTTRTVREWRAVEATFPAPLDLPGRSVRCTARRDRLGAVAAGTFGLMGHRDNPPVK